MNSGTIGRPLIRLGEIDSTNRVAGELAEEGAPEGLTVIAEAQAGGRGRLGRTWASPRGGLWSTTILRPPAERLEAIPTLAVVGGLAVAETVAGLIALHGASGAWEVQVKWPNDVLLNGRKVAGVLGQARSSRSGGPPAVLLGIGLDLNVRPGDLPPEVRVLATSVADAVGRPLDGEPALGRLMAALDSWYATWLREGFEPARRRCREWSATIGRVVTATGPQGQVAGMAVDILADGALLIRSVDGRETAVRAADVTLSEG